VEVGSRPEYRPITPLRRKIRQLQTGNRPSSSRKRQTTLIWKLHGKRSGTSQITG